MTEIINKTLNKNKKKTYNNKNDQTGAHGVNKQNSITIDIPTPYNYTHF